MILYRRIQRLYDLQELAIFFWVRISEENVGCFNVMLDTIARVDHNAGIFTIDSAPRINTFFSWENIPLIATAHPASNIADLNQFLAWEIRNGHDVWTEYHNDEIHPYDGAGMMHDSLVETVNLDTWEVVLIDPALTHKPRTTTTLSLLKRAISSKFGKEAGVIIISKKS